MREAAAGLVYLFGDYEPEIKELVVLQDDGTSVLLGWEPVPGAIGYRLSSSVLGAKFPHSWNPLLQRNSAYPPCNTRFAKAAWYRVEPLFAGQPLNYP